MAITFDEVSFRRRIAEIATETGGRAVAFDPPREVLASALFMERAELYRQRAASTTNPFKYLGSIIEARRSEVFASRIAGQECVRGLAALRG
jgi:hypothetical protein